MKWEYIDQWVSEDACKCFDFKVGNYQVRLAYKDGRLEDVDIKADGSIRFLPDIYCDVDNIRNRPYNFVISAYAARALDEEETREMMSRRQEAIDMINELGETGFNSFL